MEFFSFLRDLYDWAVSQGFTPAQVLLLILAVVFYIKPFTALKNKASEIQEKFRDVHDATREIQAHLRRMPPAYSPLHALDKLVWAKAHSPFVLNTQGAQLVERSGMQAMIHGHRDVLLSALAAKYPVTGYDVERSAFEVLSHFVAADDQ